METLQGKTAVVTGGASGIGLAMGRAFVAEGMSVVLADIEGAALDEAVSSFGRGAPVHGVPCDVSRRERVESLRDEAVERFGAVHVVCNNAGVSTGGPVWEVPEAEWEWILGVNLWGVIHGVAAFTPLLLQQNEGHIVNTASMAGLLSPTFMAPYNVTKHAVVTLTETLFGDLAAVGATGVGASVLCPGWVNTRIHEADRNRPGGPRTDVERDPAMREAIANLIGSGLSADEVALLVVDAVRRRRPYILTHPDWSPMITERAERIAAGRPPVSGPLPG